MTSGSEQGEISGNERGLTSGYAGGFKVATALGREIGFIEGYSKTALSMITSDQSQKLKQKIKIFEKLIQLCEKLELNPTTDEWMPQLDLIRKFAKQVVPDLYDKDGSGTGF